MLRVKDPSTVAWLATHFGMTLVDVLRFPQMEFDVYFMAILQDGVTVPGPPGSKAASDFLWSYPGVTLELTHNYASTDDVAWAPNNGNVEPHRGFGHIAVACEDVYAESEALEAAGVRFQKRPSEGRMKGLAFALSPEGYWIELVSAHAPAARARPLTPFTLAQTMLRVKDPVKSLQFYCGYLGMTLLSRRHYEGGSFSLYFLGTLEEGTHVPDVDSPEAQAWVKAWPGCTLELTHNWGTEADPDFAYHDGNSDTETGAAGFGHVAFLVPDVYAATDVLRDGGYTVHKEVDGGAMPGISFVLDPDGYRVELIPRGGHESLLAMSANSYASAAGGGDSGGGVVGQ